MLHKYIELIYDRVNDHLNSNFEEKNILKIVNNLEINKYITNTNVLKENSLENYILINICDIKLEEITLNPHYYEQRGDSYIKCKKPFNFNIYIYFHSTFCNENYLKGISYLSSIISYFHSNSSFNNENTSEIIENNLSEFTVNIINDENNKCYDNLKIPYIPSFLVKLGLIPISGENNLNQTFAGIKQF